MTCQVTSGEESKLSRCNSSCQGEVTMNKAQEIGARIGEAVRLTGQTNRRFAKALGVSAPTLGRYITGETEPPAATMARIAELSGRPIAWFYQEQDVEAGQEVAATLVRIFGDLMAGRTPDEAYDR